MAFLASLLVIMATCTCVVGFVQTRETTSGDELFDVVMSLKNEVVELKRKSAEHECEIAKFKEKNTEYETEIVRLNNGNEEHKSRLTVSEGKNAEQARDIERLKKGNEECKSRITVSEEKNAEHETEIVRLKRDNEEHTGRITLSEEKNAEHEKEVLKFKRNNAEQANEISGLRTSLGKPQDPRVKDGLVAFSTYLSDDQRHIRMYQKIMFDTVLLNEGNGYKTNLGAFIAPKKGLYLVAYTISKMMAGETRVLLMANEKVINGAVVHVAKTFEFEQAGNVALIELDVGDAVYVENNVFNDSVVVGSIDRSTTFSGVLLM